jgi:hypothetical protein
MREQQLCIWFLSVIISASIITILFFLDGNSLAHQVPRRIELYRRVDANPNATTFCTFCGPIWCEMTQRRLLPPRLQNAPKAKAVSIEKIAEDDWLYGAEDIRAFLGLSSPGHVYRIKDRGGAPIGKLPGIGLAARKTDLDAWRAIHVPPLAR